MTISVPVNVGEEGTLFNTTGVLRLEDQKLVLGFQNIILGFFKQAPKEVELPLEGVAAVEFERGFMGIYNTITVQLHRMALFADVPTSSGGMVRLYVEKAQLPAAAELVSRAKLEISEHSLKQLDKPRGGRL